MSTDDKYACAEVIQSWALFRDQGRWAELLDTFWLDGTIAVSWFRGTFADFVERCRTRSPRAGRAKHLMLPSVVHAAGHRAVAETSTVIHVRQDFEGIVVDLTSNARFLDRLEKRGPAWKMVERTCVYEHDRLDPVEPSAAFDEMLRRADCSRYAPQYRYMAYRLEAAGGTLAMPLHCDGLAETAALRARYGAWLAGDAASSH